MPCGVDCVGASSGRAEGLEPQLRTRMLTLIFVFGRALDGFWEGFGRILEGIWGLKFNIFRSFSENVDIAKIVVFPKGNCYFSGVRPPEIDAKSKQNRVREKFVKKRPKIMVSFRLWDHFGRPWEA